MKALITAATLWLGAPLAPTGAPSLNPGMTPAARPSPAPLGLLAPVPLSAAAPSATPPPLSPQAAALETATPTTDIAGDAFDGRPARAQGQELNQEFTALHAAVRDGYAGPLPVRARDARYLFVGGMFASRTPDYFGGNLRRMNALGLSAAAVPLNTQGRRYAGLRAIEAAVAGSREPVVLIGHSRGGVLIHDWYRGASAELKAKVERIVLLQAPLTGTPFADWSIKGRWDRLKLRWLGPIIFGSNLFRTVAEMTPRVRGRVLAALPLWGPNDLEKVYTLGTAVSSLRGYYERRRAVMTRLGAGENDGLVTVASSRVAGGRNILLRGVEHKHTVLQRPNWLKRLQGYRPHPNYDAGDLTEAFVRLLFR